MDNHEESVMRLMSMASLVSGADMVLATIRTVQAFLSDAEELNLPHELIVTMLKSVLSEMFTINHDNYMEIMKGIDPDQGDMVQRVTDAVTQVEGWKYSTLTEVIVMELLLQGE